jgi:hypothetical protein
VSGLVGFRRTRTSHRWLGNVVLFVVSLGVTCALGELMVRVLLPQQLIIKRPDIWQGADRLGWAHRPNVSVELNTGERTVLFVTDHDGYRVGRSGRVAGHRQILLLGDSFVEAAQVDYEDSLAGLLETRLSRRFGTAVAIRNTGVGGWDPPQYLLQARLALSREPFDLILVVVFLGNDVVSRRTEDLLPRLPTEVHEFRFPQKASYSEIRDTMLYPLNDVLEVRSHLFILLKTRLAVVLMRLGLSADDFPEVFYRSEATSPRWEITADIIAEIAHLGEQSSTPTLIVLLPTVFQVEHEIFEEYLRGFGIDRSRVDLQQPDMILGAALRARGLTVVDLLPILREAHGRGAISYGRIDRHLSAEGHSVIAQHLEPIVATHLRRRGSASPAPR